MILTDYFYPTPDLTWQFAPQCGVGHGVIRLPDTQDFDLTDKSHWDALCSKFHSYGIQPLVVEPLPNALHDHIKAGDEKRDASIDAFLKMLPIMKEQGLTTVCFNFMAHVGWTRTASNLPERGGAQVTGFRMDDYIPTHNTITAEALWDNYTYFLKAALPEAEKQGIQLALHPDDPPLPRLGNVERIMISLENIQKAMTIVPSPMLGVTYCQATYHMMGEDVYEAARALADKIFFIHFRNCRGDLMDFRETFHDNGEINMAKIIALYRELGLNVPIRVDHVPQMAGEAHGVPGYTALGRLYAIGYLKGLLEMHSQTKQNHP